MGKKFKVGILGLKRGSSPFWGMKKMTDHVIIAGVCEQDKETLDSMREHFDEETVVYDTYEEMINSGLDAVVLCDFFHTHCQHAIQALDKGIAVFSETTAAPSLGECVDLVEAVERNNGKYMLMANCSYFSPIQYAKMLLDEERYGQLLYADAEYVHPVDPETQRYADMENLHWRETLPQCYYNMHTLGPLMYATGTVPVKVMAKAVVHQHKRRATNTPKTFNITEMDNGAVFNTTGCAGVGTVSKWYRFACERGTIETERPTENINTLLHMGLSTEEISRVQPTVATAKALSKEDIEEFSSVIESGGHGGCDGVLNVEILKYLQGKSTPFFDVYRSVALSAAGILSWYSILNGGKEYEIPDFKNPAERDKVRGDYRKPFGKTINDLTLPCRLDKDGE